MPGDPRFFYKLCHYTSAVTSFLMGLRLLTEPDFLPVFLPAIFFACIAGGTHDAVRCFENDNNEEFDLESGHPLVV
ncbi:MAG TPA: hypothetical protein VHD33_07310 [Legionellaceae bacterium]|nr:hypothetical protein [Legionellaceae bacterium]